ncbi:MAG TPA: hypothetical protein VMU61_00550 [Candidatus Aquilonibacter sp.]|nr:hypothetical protein [Candidatus Aquilonibacter sp.]
MKRSAIAVGLVLCLSTILLAGKNLADYPLQIQVVESHWHRHRDGSVDGWGRGNIRDGGSIHAFDFTYESAAPFQRTIGTAHYLAKWKKPTLKLEMLVGEIGAPGKFYTFDLKTNVREDVYVPSPEGAVAISQEEYKAKQPQ